MCSIRAGMLFGLVTLACTTLASAQGPPAEVPGAAPAADTDGPKLEFRFTPGVWLPRATGDARLGGSGDLQFKGPIDLRSQETTFVLDVDVVLNDTWLFHFDGFDFDTSGGGVSSEGFSWGNVAIAPGDSFTSSFDYTSIAAEVGYTFLRPYADEPNGGIEFAAIGGVRYLDLDQQVTRIEPTTRTSDKGDGTWIGPYAGLQFDVEYRPDPGTLPFRAGRLFANVGFGPAFGGDGGTFWHIRTALSIEFDEHLAVLFGWRLSGANVEDGRYEYNGSLQGIFVAGTIQF